MAAFCIFIGPNGDHWNCNDRNNLLYRAMKKILKFLEFILFSGSAAALAFSIVEKEAFAGIGWFCACLLSGMLFLDD